MPGSCCGTSLLLASPVLPFEESGVGLLCFITSGLFVNGHRSNSITTNMAASTVTYNGTVCAALKTPCGLSDATYTGAPFMKA